MRRCAPKHFYSLEKILKFLMWAIVQVLPYERSCLPEHAAENLINFQCRAGDGDRESLTFMVLS